MDDAGTGKTHMLGAICSLCCQQMRPARFFTASSPVMRLRRARDAGSPDRELAQLARAGILGTGELGHPTRHSLRAWHKDCLGHGEVRPPKRQREPKSALEMGQAAVDCCLAHGRSPARTMRRMGYPASRERLCGWIDGLPPGQRKHRGPNPRREPVSVEEKVQAIAEPEARTGPAAEIAERHGVSRTAPYVWRRETMGDNGGDTEGRGVPVSREYDGLPDDVEVLQDM